MKFLLILVALFCLAYCHTPQFGKTADDKISQDFDKVVDNAENPLVISEDKNMTSQLFQTIACTHCICTKTNAYGYAAYALCYLCHGITGVWRICSGCYCCGRPFGIYDAYYAFCRKCRSC